MANIQVDGKEQVWVNGVKVKAKRADGALQFRQGTILYTLQGIRVFAMRATGMTAMFTILAPSGSSNRHAVPRLGH